MSSLSKVTILATAKTEALPAGKVMNICGRVPFM